MSRRATAAGIVLAAIVGYALILDIGTLRRAVLLASAAAFLLIHAVVASAPRPTRWRSWKIEKAIQTVVNLTTGFGMGYGFMGTAAWGFAGAAFLLALVVWDATLDLRGASPSNDAK
jgi:hypothetical protein